MSDPNSKSSAPGAPASLLRLLNAGHGTIPEAMTARTALTPDRPFLHWERHTWTYREAVAMAHGVGGYFRKMTTPDRPRVATFLGNCPEAMWTWLGAMFSGKVLVPINRKHRGTLLADMLSRSGASLLVTDATALNEIAPELLAAFEAVVIVGDLPVEPTPSMKWERIAPFQEAQCDGMSRWAPIRSSDVACVMFTSGTTGRSKAVPILHNQYVRGAARLVDAYQLTADDVFHNWLPLFHLAGQLHMTMTAILCGGAVALQPTFSVSRFWEEIELHGCSVLCGFASILHFIESLPPRVQDAASSLRVGIFAGIPPTLHDRFERRFGMRLDENYGMTEIDPITYPEPGVEPPEASCGRPSADVELAIVDDNDQLLPAGQLGEIVVRPRAPDVLTPGYDGDERASMRTFRNLWFHTGDFGALDDRGFLYFKGRAEHYIRRRGENVSVAELEAIILTHTAISECAAVGVASELGEEDIKIVVALHPGCTISAAELWDYAAARMAAFMRPRYIEFVGQLPRGELGKVRISDLRQLSERTWGADIR